MAVLKQQQCCHVPFRVQQTKGRGWAEWQGFSQEAETWFLLSGQFDVACYFTCRELCILPQFFNLPYCKVSSAKHHTEHENTVDEKLASVKWMGIFLLTTQEFWQESELSSAFFFFSVLYFKAFKDPDSFRTPLNIKFKLSEFKCYELKFPVLDIVTPRHISLSWEPQKPT